MKNIKKLGFSIFAFILILFGGVYFAPNFFVSADSNLYTGDVVNNVFYVTFSDGDINWINEVPETQANTFNNGNYTKTVKQLMENSYNTSVSSVKEYYKAQSFNSLNLTSNFYTNSNSAYTLPYTKNQLLPYSKKNTSGYLEYDICSYSGSKPAQMSLDFFTKTTHLFSAYNCNNSKHDGSSSKCDLSYGSGDDVACICAYYKYIKDNPTKKVTDYEHLERYFREQVAIKTLLSKISNLSGNVDRNNDGKVDAITFIFPNITDTVNWNDLLWAHQMSLADLSSYKSFSGILKMAASNHGLRNLTDDDLDIILKNVEISGKMCYDYNLYTFHDLLPKSAGKTFCLKDKNGLQLINNYTLAHELGHVLGLPDYYIYDDNDKHDDPVTFWDLMAYAYTGTPLYMTTYNREKLGFTNSANIKKITNSGSYELYPTNYDEINNSNNNSNKVLAYVYQDPAYPNQKIYIEYRTMEGKFESGLKNWVTDRKDGLIVYRVDEGVKQVNEYSGMLSSGNFMGYPYNLYVFRDDKNYALNSNFTTMNNITFQTYDSTKDQKELLKDDITFTDSGLTITFETIENGKIKFNITGGNLTTEDTRDLNSITLIGDDTIDIEVNSSYTDLGIDYGEFSSDEFNISIDNKININKLGTYTYSYTLTLKTDTTKTKTLTRTIRVVDTTKPTVTLIGEDNLTISSINDYVEQGINYSDNYDEKSNLTKNISDLIYVSENYYKVEYSVTDSSGNETIICRYITILANLTDFSSVKLNGKTNIEHDVKTNYVDSGIDFGTFIESEFTIERTNTVNINVLGSYTYSYKLTYNSTHETFNLVRTINVVDKIAPTITLLGENDISKFLSELSSYNDKNVAVSDNYNTADDIVIITRLEKINDSLYYYFYKAKDSSGNESEEIYRLIRIEYKPLQQSQIRIEIKNNSSDTTFYTDTVIRFATRIDYNRDNLQGQTIRFFINDVEINTSGDYFTYKFTRDGIYGIKVQVGDTIKETEIIVKDISTKPVDTQKMSMAVMLGIIAGIILFLFVVIIVCSKAKEIKNNLDKY